MQSLKPFYGLIMPTFSSSTANATAAGRRVFGEGGVITYYNNVTCVGTESKLNVCQSIYSTSSRLDCGYAGVFCQSKFGPFYGLACLAGFAVHCHRSRCDIHHDYGSCRRDFTDH